MKGHIQGLKGHRRCGIDQPKGRHLLGEINFLRGPNKWTELQNSVYKLLVIFDQKIQSNYIEVVQGDIFMEQKIRLFGRLAILKKKFGPIITVKDKPPTN